MKELTFSSSIIIALSIPREPRYEVFEKPIFKPEINMLKPVRKNAIYFDPDEKLISQILKKYEELKISMTKER